MQPKSSTFNLEATVEALQVIKKARIEAVTGPDSVHTLLAHAYYRLDAELGDYLRGETLHERAVRQAQNALYRGMSNMTAPGLR